MVYEVGTRFTNGVYIKTAFDPDNATCDVDVEIKIEGEEPINAHGTVVWEMGE